jgi:Putative Flp pilus-assembly TadE/G-like
MPRLITNPQARRRGIVAVLVAVLLTGVLGVVAIAVDGGMMQDNRRRVQAAADAAALAAAAQMYAEYRAIVASNYMTADPGYAAAAAAQGSATANGYANDGTNNTVTVNIPPTSGPFTGKIGYAEVIITYNQPRYFSGIWGSTKIPVRARAVSQGAWAPSGDGIIVLDPTAKNSLYISGTSSLTVTGGAKVIVDSNNPTSAANDSGGGVATAGEFDVTGGVNGTFNGTVVTGTPPIPDPLAYLPVPAMPPNGTMTSKHLPGGGTQYTFTPGTYNSMPNFTNGDVVILGQASTNSAGGIYYLNGTGFTSNGANISMDATTTGGVMLYNNPTNSSNSQGISIQGNATGVVSMSALTDGPYAGILFWQNRTAAQTMSISGSGTFNLTGTFYTPNAQLSVSGGGAASVGSQYISRTLAITGGGNVSIAYSDKGTARMRIIKLVE